MVSVRLSLLALLLAVPLASSSPLDCEDDNPSCAEWATAGECTKNAGYMRAACAKSCDSCPPPVSEELVVLGDERVVMEVANHGSITLGFYPNAAPVTVKHILNLFRLGCYDTDHIFRVDKGFVAQVQTVYQGAVTQTLSEECTREAEKTVPAEFTAVPHVKGILSMGRMADPDSGGSSFSMLLGKAPHLDAQYTVFGRVLAGLDVLESLETVETTREGIFVMPKVRIEITRAYVIDGDAKTDL